MDFQDKFIKLEGKIYEVHDTSIAKIADSFVVNTNKVGHGSGESRLYVSSQSEKQIFNFSTTDTLVRGKKSYFLCNKKCFLSKDNLQKYLEDAQLEYLYPKQNYRENISLLYQDRLDLLDNLKDEIYFKIFNQNGDLDSKRFYIGSIDKAWNIIRMISLPKCTTLIIYKIINKYDKNDILYYFELNYDNSTKKVKKNIKYQKHSKQKQELETLTNIKNDTTIDFTERTTLIKARNGQGRFRKNVLEIMPFCPFTNISSTCLLRASHIMPWAQCSNNHQRLDGYNGLALTPTYDVLFDSGLISFNNDGSLLISDRLPSDVISALNLIPNKIYNIQNIEGKRDEYLEYHRNNIFN